MMRQTVALAAFATLVLVGPVLGQQRDKEDKRGLSSDPLEALARKAALRLAGFEPQEGEETDPDGSTDIAKPKLRVYYDDNGMLMVDGRPDEIARFEHAYDLVIEKMRQVGPAKPDIRKYKCRHIDVSYAAALLDDVFNGPKKARQRAAAQQRGRQQQQRGGRQQQRGRQPEPEPEPEPETGGMGRGMGMLETLFGGGDAKSTDPTELMGIQIVPDKRTNYLFIMAKTDLFPQIIDTLYSIDVETEQEISDSDIVVLQRLNADEVKAMLEELLGITDARAAQQAGTRARRAAQQRRGRGQQGQGAAQLAEQMQEELLQIGLGGEFKLSDIKISSLAATNTIIVFGPKEARTSIVDIIKKLDEQGPDVLAESFALKNADAVSLAKALRDTYVKSGKDSAKNVTITANAETNTIYVRAPKNIRQEITLRIGEADLHADGKKLRTIQLVLGDAKTIAVILKEAFDKPGKGRSEIIITPDEIANRLIVSAPPDTFEEIAKLAAVMDRADPDQVLPRTIKLKYASASLVKTKVKELARDLAMSDPQGKKESGAFAVMDDPSTNSLIVVASPKLFAFVELAVKSIDAPPEGGEIVRYTLALEYISADVAAGLVNDYFSQHYAARGRGTDIPVTVVPGPGGKHLFVNASAENKQIIDDLLAKIDTEEGEGAERPVARVYRFKHADGATLANIINQAFPGGRGTTPEERVHASFEPDTQSLVVTANSEHHEDVARLLEDIDKENGTDRRSFRTVKLANGDVTAVAQTLQQLINDQQRGRRNQVKPSVVADAASNRLMIYASQSEMDKFQPLIDAMDEEGSAASSPQRIELKHANAAQLADLLTQVFTVPARQPQRGRGGGSQKIVPLIMSDDVTNTLIVRAAELDFGQIKKMVADLDKETEDGPSSIRIITVAQGTDVETFGRNLERLIRQGERARREQNRNYKPKNVSIMADLRTNTLIVSGASSQFDEVERIARTLESMKPGGTTNIRVVPLKNIRSSDVKRVLDNLIEQRNQSSRGRGRRR